MEVEKQLLDIDSIIFDLDGTLWNASKTAAKAWNLALYDIGFSNIVVTEKNIRDFSGIPLGVLLETRFSNIPIDKRNEFIPVYAQYERAIMKEGGIIFPGVKETLETLADNRKLFIVSNCLEGYIENFLEYSKFSILFTGHKSSGRTGKTKSENIQLIIQENCLKDSVYVGDTEFDQDACREAGIPFVYASYGFGKVEKPEYYIERFPDILQLIE